MSQDFETKNGKIDDFRVKKTACYVQIPQNVTDKKG